VLQELQAALNELAASDSTIAVDVAVPQESPPRPTNPSLTWPLRPELPLGRRKEDEERQIPPRSSETNARGPTLSFSKRMNSR